MISSQFNRKIQVFALGFLTSITSALHSTLIQSTSILSNSSLTTPLTVLIANQTPAYPTPMIEQVACQISETFTDEVKAWESDICRWSDEQELDPDIIATIMQIESCGNNFAVSSTGVKGLFQVTGANLAGKNGFDPDSSASAGPGMVYKEALAAANGDIRAAMAGYNGGGWARQYIAGEINRNQFTRLLRSHRLWPTQAKALAKVNEVERYAQWSDIYFEAKENRTDTLQTWLNLGGYRLCNDAATQLGLSPRYSRPTPNSPVIAADTETKH